jgi:hypothetical protein
MIETEHFGALALVRIFAEVNPLGNVLPAFPACLSIVTVPPAFFFRQNTLEKKTPVRNNI